MKLKVVSFNVQHFIRYLEQRIDIDFFEQVLRSLDADVIGLNEVYGGGVMTDQVAEMGRRLGYHTFFAKAIDAWGEGPYGNGLLSRYPILSARTVQVPDPEVQNSDGYYETRCILQAQLDVPLGLQVNVVHMGLNPEEQQSAICELCGRVSPSRALLMGDFNTTPDDLALCPLLSFMQDSARLFDEEKLSFPSDAPEMKIDYILHTPDLAALSADIPPLVTSDHRPHIAIFEV